MRRTLIIKYFFVFVIIAVSIAISHKESTQKFSGNRIYWFIPDGLRSEPITFKIYEWARNGELPNLKHLIENGSYGYSRPVFPSHTPTNFATLTTGTTPDIHGIADGAMRISGYPIKMVSRGGFSSGSRLVPSIWDSVEKNNLQASMISVPGSTPPTIQSGEVVRGRWGNWGVDFPAIIFQNEKDDFVTAEIGQNKRVFTFGSDLTKFVPLSKVTGWSSTLYGGAKPLYEVNLSNWGSKLFALVLDNSEVIISADKSVALCKLTKAKWSDWIQADLKWNAKSDYNINTPKKSDIENDLSSLELHTQFKVNVILAGEKSFRVRIIYNSINEFLTYPDFLAEKLTSTIGPMTDFVDNYPPQLIYYNEDKQTFLDEMNMSFDWHKAAVHEMVKNSNSSLIIHSIYSPNQMLTSRWWLPFLDPRSPTYKTITETERAVLWAEVKSMYKKIDLILGEILKEPSVDTIVFSSDHGIAPLYREVRLNNLFAKKGWLKFSYNSKLDQFVIDWENSKVVFLQMHNIYINPDGLGGNLEHRKDKKYEQLREEVIKVLNELEDETTKTRVVDLVLKNERASELNLPADRVGDLVVANTYLYSFTEDTSTDLAVFKSSLKGGYKQAILPDKEPALLTPFVIYGKNIKKNFQLPETINHVDQYQTIMHLLRMPAGNYSKGSVLDVLAK